MPVLPPGHRKTKQLWMTYFIDCYSRMIMGWMVSVRQSSDAVLEALRDAIALDPEHGNPHGGKPLVVMYDNGLEFLAEVVPDAAAYLDFRTHAIAPEQRAAERLSSRPGAHGAQEQPRACYAQGAITEVQLLVVRASVDLEEGTRSLRISRASRRVCRV